MFIFAGISFARITMLELQTQSEDALAVSTLRAA